MSDSVVSETPNPDLFPESPNESSGETPIAAEGSYAEKIRRVAKGVFERHGVLFKRGGGRPKKDGSPNKLDIPLTHPPTAIPLAAASSPPETDPNFDAALVKRCCTAVLKAFRGFADKFLFNKARKAGHSQAEASQLVTDTTVTSEEADSFSELAEICLRKYGVGTQYCPEIGLAAVVLGVGVRYGAAISILNAKIQEDRKRAEERDAA